MFFVNGAIMNRLKIKYGIAAALLLAGGCCMQKPDSVKDTPADPALGPNLLDVASSQPDLSTFVELIKSAGLEDRLKGAGPYTVFAPTNAAFAKMPAADFANLKKPENKAKLVERLEYHIAKGNFTAKDLPSKVRFPSIMGDSLEIQAAGTTLKVGNDEAMSGIIKTDIHAGNGTIHVIDRVFEPD